MDLAQIALFIVTLAILTLVIYLAAGLVSGDWSHSAGTWLRFILVALIATLLIPALQAAAGYLDAGDLALLIAFIVIMFLIYALIIPELAVGDEWMTAVFASFLAVFVLYVVERIVEAVFQVSMFSFI